MNTLKLAKLLSNERVEIHFAVQKDSRLSERLEELNFPVVLLDGVRKYFDFKNARTLRNYLNEGGIDTVISPYRADLDLLMWTKRRMSGKLRIIHQQHMQFGKIRRGYLRKLRYAAVDNWISPLESLREEVIEKTTIPREKTVVIPIGVETSKFEGLAQDQQEARQQLNCSTNAKLVGVIGRIDRKKGQLFLARAIQTLRQEGEDVELLIVGEPTVNDPEGAEYYAELKQYLTDHDLTTYVHFTGFTNDVSSFFSAIDVFVMSSERETYGMVTLEAMLNKTPVIGSDSGGTPELLGNGSRGVLYRHNDLISFLTAYRQLNRRLQNGELDLELIKSEIRQQYSIERELEGILKLLELHQISN